MTSSRPRRRSDALLLLSAIFILVFCNLTATAEPVIASIGFPVSAEAGQPIHVRACISSSVPIRELDGVVLHYYNPGTGVEDWVWMNLTEGTLSDGTWSYDIPAQPWEGQLKCRVTATDQAGASGQYPASGDYVIQIIGDEEPRPFPWNLVFIIAFLAVALILTELVFKPGFYRKTGREKARELEEEDRRREQETGRDKK